jgi:plastocyanin
MRLRLFPLCLLLLSAAALGEEHVVSQKDKQFSQPAIRIARGDTIRFVNEDTLAHNVFARSEVVEFNVKLQEPGSSDVVRFPKAGVVEVRCAIHPKMKIKVEVAP